MRRLAITNQGPRTREIDVTTYVEIALAAPAADLAHPAFGKLFLETEYVPASSALLCHRRPRGPADAPLWAVHVLSLEGRTQGPIEWETDRAQFLGRGRDPRRARGARRPHAVRHHRRRPRSHLQSAPAHQARPGRDGAPVVCDRRRRRSGRRPRARAEVPGAQRGDARVRPRARARAERAASPGDLARRRAAVRAARVARAVRRRVAARAAGRARGESRAVNPDCGGTASRAISPSCSCTSSAPTRCRSCGRSCRRRSTGA